MFDNILLGNEKAKNVLLDQTKRLFSHAVLIYGDSGLGKMTLARMFACRCVFGERYKSDESFFVQDECRLVMEDIHPDVLVLGTESPIKVDDVRQMIDWVGVKPNQAANKVCILKNCETMRVQAANALLKTLEEPPNNTVIILHCGNLSAIIPTIMSRVQTVGVENVDYNICMEFLRKRYPEKTEDEFDDVLSIYGGNIGRLIKLLDGDDENPAFKIADDVVSSVCKGSMFETARNLERMKNNREMFGQFLDRFIEIMQMALSVKSGSDENERYAHLGDRLSYEYIGRTIKLMNDLRRRLVFMPSLPLTYSWLAVSLCKETSPRPLN